jgi:hypothetical protein
MQISSLQAFANSRKQRVFELKTKTFIRVKSEVRVHNVNEEIISKLNNLAGVPPFCNWYKQKKHDPL